MSGHLAFQFDATRPDSRPCREALLYFQLRVYLLDMFVTDFHVDIIISELTIISCKVPPAVMNEQIALSPCEPENRQLLKHEKIIVDTQVAKTLTSAIRTDSRSWETT